MGGPHRRIEVLEVEDLELPFDRALPERDHRGDASRVDEGDPVLDRDVPLEGLVDATLDVQRSPGFRPGHFDDAPTVYVHGQPGRTDPAVRQLEKVSGQLTATNPYTGKLDT